MKHVVGIGVLVAIAFVLRFWLHTGLAGVYCECSPEALRIPTNSFHA